MCFCFCVCVVYVVFTGHVQGKGSVSLKVCKQSTACLKTHTHTHIHVHAHSLCWFLGTEIPLSTLRQTCFKPIISITTQTNNHKGVFFSKHWAFTHLLKHDDVSLSVMFKVLLMMMVLWYSVHGKDSSFLLKTHLSFWLHIWQSCCPEMF